MYNHKFPTSMDENPIIYAIIDNTSNIMVA